MAKTRNTRPSPPPPTDDDKIRVIPQQTKEGEQKWRVELMRHALCTLTANLLRVARGAGHPYAIINQAIAFLDAAREAGGHRDFHIAIDALRSWDDTFSRDRFENTLRGANNMIVQGALQIVASRLLGQRPQEARGELELFDGLAARYEFEKSQRRKAEQS